MGLIKEFKDFAMKGNVIDMAVGVIIGTAFGKIVSSLVNDIIMPPLGMLIGKKEFVDLSYELGTTYEIRHQKTGKIIEQGQSAILKYGAFLQTIFDFLIIAIAIFIMVKIISVAKAKFEKQEQKTIPIVPENILLLREIRDELRTLAEK